MRPFVCLVLLAQVVLGIQEWILVREASKPYSTSAGAFDPQKIPKTHYVILEAKPEYSRAISYHVERSDAPDPRLVRIHRSLRHLGTRTVRPGVNPTCRDNNVVVPLLSRDAAGATPPFAIFVEAADPRQSPAVPYAEYFKQANAPQLPFPSSRTTWKGVLEQPSSHEVLAGAGLPKDCVIWYLRNQKPRLPDVSVPMAMVVSGTLGLLWLLVIGPTIAKNKSTGEPSGEPENPGEDWTPVLEIPPPVLGPFLVTCMGLFLTGAVILLRDASGSYSGKGWEGPASVIFGNLFMIAAAGMARSHFAVSAAGLTSVSAVANTYVRMPWSEVAAVTLGAFDPPRNLPHVLVQTWSTSGSTIRRTLPIDSGFASIAPALALVRSAVEADLWSRAKSALGQGETLDLGRLKITQSELTISGQLGAFTARTFPLTTLESVEIERDRTLVVQGESNGSSCEARCPLVDVKNVFLLAPLLAERVPGAHKRLRFSWE